MMPSPPESPPPGDMITEWMLRKVLRRRYRRSLVRIGSGSGGPGKVSVYFWVPVGDRELGIDAADYGPSGRQR